MADTNKGDLKITSLRVTEGTKKKLAEHGKKGQSFDDIINELMNKVNGVK